MLLYAAESADFFRFDMMPIFAAVAMLITPISLIFLLLKVATPALDFHVALRLSPFFTLILRYAIAIRFSMLAIRYASAPLHITPLLCCCRYHFSVRRRYVRSLR